MLLQLTCTYLVVNNIERSIEFYQAILGVPAE